MKCTNFCAYTSFFTTFEMYKLTWRIIFAGYRTDEKSWGKPVIFSLAFSEILNPDHRACLFCFSIFFLRESSLATLPIIPKVIYYVYIMIYLQLFGNFQSWYLEGSSSILKFCKNENNLFFITIQNVWALVMHPTISTRTRCSDDHQ